MRQAIAQGVDDDGRKNAEYKGLPGVEAHIAFLIVGRDGKEEDRRDEGDVGECAKRILREARLILIGHDPSYSG